MRRLATCGRVLATVVIAVLAFGLLGGPAAARPWPLQLNEAGCTDASRANPVVLVHGTADTARAWQPAMVPELVARGFCVYSYDYGAMLTTFGQVNGVAPVRESVSTLKDVVDRVLRATGAAEVDLVGHSQGGMLGLNYLKFRGGADKVRNFVGLAPVTHGTDLNGWVKLTNASVVGRPLTEFLLNGFCASCTEMQADSDSVRRLNTGPIAQAGVRYTVIATRSDQTATPAGKASFIDEPGVRNSYVQDECSGKRLRHEQLPADPAVVRMVSNTLAPGASGPLDCG
ncbi:alpha/beta hydrolase family protein [Tamaricihabitans halophyticus]|uniref:Alpha/beta hydrolase family protein n=1 Tax=Tamaricihabitans halophyticus TaxID=1262583 RepID=A0A4R2QV23_9PSEU|nr:alpha/beta fold hydrolase [Tamaricihabitans halophyticus]TCP50881.1 alpha/beta hydrolase family protein [Tamaricihabitans halophyticus]